MILTINKFYTEETDRFSLLVSIGCLLRFRFVHDTPFQWKKFFLMKDNEYLNYKLFTFFVIGLSLKVKVNLSTKTKNIYKVLSFYKKMFSLTHHIGSSLENTYFQISTT